MKSLSDIIEFLQEEGISLEQNHSGGYDISPPAPAVFLTLVMSKLMHKFRHEIEPQRHDWYPGNPCPGEPESYGWYFQAKYNVFGDGEYQLEDGDVYVMVNCTNIHIV